MAHACGIIIKFYSVVKGYHVYKDRMNEGEQYKCFPEPENCLDKCAVVVKCVSTGKVVGHVPAIPTKLNVAILDILRIDNSIYVLCRARGVSRVSSYPWPDQHSTGGGAVIPVEYVIYSPTMFERQILDHLNATVVDFPELQELMALSVDRSGERTPPMVLSNNPDAPDTPDYKNYTQ